MIRWAARRTQDTSRVWSRDWTGVSRKNTTSSHCLTREPTKEKRGSCTIFVSHPIRDDWRKIIVLLETECLFHTMHFRRGTCTVPASTRRCPMTWFLLQKHGTAARSPFFGLLHGFLHRPRSACKPKNASSCSLVYPCLLVHVIFFWLSCRSPVFHSRCSKIEHTCNMCTTSKN